MVKLETILCIKESVVAQHNWLQLIPMGPYMAAALQLYLLHGIKSNQKAFQSRNKRWSRLVREKNRISIAIDPLD